MLDISFDSLTRPQWEDLFAQAGQSALVQSWAYGEAKRAEGWTPRRLLIHQDGKPLALAQVLEKRVAGLARIARLNRGPVWLGPLALEDQLAIITALRRPWRLWRAAALFIAPELEQDHASRLGLIRRKAPCWGSAWIDLTQPLDVLRKRLDGKWRNMLVGAEKAGLSADISATAETRLWLMGHYAALMRDKHFTGMPSAQITALAQSLCRPEDLLVIRALTPEDEAVGGILLARHGTSATYLVGWNGDMGRKLKANNFLLWQAIVTLQAQGCRWLDLGGIDAALTPGIAAFKRGMKGQEYCLAGEFLSL
ncbi:lipid II:glycine glycyltransferase FemX [Magnetospirillum sulfuroxidans]|uniref:Peptidoglycan bridge formation glycyltransferase FemA/FemB family protein n=1 Tax=Magnetospirillum sulfuroxidans TaxID=611300 RepID=A0ABS5IIV2_9PROT|nr:GNAT family N-acetyltransferase [Magnetospirillum sulfuroxidans]MBR9973703.1 peptidoglycan bridge formation glycyltransferase FemA/FemB family protein [Magnetospirillum sulfuroxidans]